LILITHDHGDHASMADVVKIQKPDTVIVTTVAAAAKLSGQIKTVKPGEDLTVKASPSRPCRPIISPNFAVRGYPIIPRRPVMPVM
jgi:glyoxylase-like metal-dependent hydrolase (beta-lactamase superfamily II)